MPVHAGQRMVAAPERQPDHAPRGRVRSDRPGQHPMTGDAPFRTITEHARALSAKEYSAIELTDLFLGRIERHSPVFNSFITVAPEAARARGEAAPQLGIPLA